MIYFDNFIHITLYEIVIVICFCMNHPALVGDPAPVTHSAQIPAALQTEERVKSIFGVKTMKVRKIICKSLQSQARSPLEAVSSLSTRCQTAPRFQDEPGSVQLSVKSYL